MRPTTFAPLLTLALCSSVAFAQSQSAPPAAPTDLDAFMGQALQKRETDRRTLGDYVLDEIETFEILGPGRVPLNRYRREYTWYVREGIHVRSPVKFDGLPIPEADRRAYEERWFRREQERHADREKRQAQRKSEGQPPTPGPAGLYEPRYVSASYFMDFKFEPGNYYLAGREQLDGHEVLRIDYYPTHLFEDDDQSKDAGKKTDPKANPEKRSSKEERAEQDIERKMNKTALVTLWVDPVDHRIVKYTFDNVWMDFLPAGWLVHIDDIRASMEMGQPFEGVWLPRNLAIHAGVTLANGSFEATYRREFANYRKADVSSRVRVPKQEAR